jgi:hypothetical protein
MLLTLIGLFIIYRGFFSRKPRNIPAYMNVKGILLILLAFIIMCAVNVIKFIIRLFHPDFGKKTINY